MKLPHYVSLALLILLSGVRLPGWAQVRIPTMGDTTSRSSEDTVRYGPETTHYFQQRDLQYNRASLGRMEQQTLDTTQTGVYNFHPVEAAGNNLQYLGTLGMATRPIFPEPPDVSGVLFGINAFDAYVTDPREIKYYNTRSPYILLHPTFGGEGRNVGEVIFTQNVRPNLNVGVAYQWLSIEPQIGPGASSRNDRVVESSQLNVFAYYQTKNEKYDLLANFTRFGHNVEEYGGIDAELDDEGDPRAFFQYRNSQVWLDAFNAKELRFNYHVYHQYKLNELLQVYHEFDRRHQDDYFDNELNDVVGDTASAYFRRILIDTARTADAVRYELWNNEFGLKGSLANLFYSIHYRIRQSRVDYNRDTLEVIPEFGVNQVRDQRLTELYAGFDLRFDLSDSTYLRGGADYLSAESYRLEAAFNSPILKGKFVRARTLPTFMASQFIGNHNYWHNDFDPVGMDQLSGSIEYAFPNLYLRPFITATNINKPIYYRRDTVPELVPPDTVRLVSRQAYPEQASGGVRILSLGVEFNADFLKRLHIQNRVTYTTRTGPAAAAFPIPEWLAFSRLYYENRFRDNKITLQLGVDAQFTSSYLAYDYDVATRQFFLQPDGEPNNGPIGELDVPYPGQSSYLVMNAFFTMKVRTAVLYVKVPYLNQGLPRDGYFASPFYAGQQRTLADIGIRWMFFD